MTNFLYSLLLWKILLLLHPWHEAVSAISINGMIIQWYSKTRSTQQILKDSSFHVSKKSMNSFHFQNESFISISMQKKDKCVGDISERHWFQIFLFKIMKKKWIRNMKLSSSHSSIMKYQHCCHKIYLLHNIFFSISHSSSPPIVRILQHKRNLNYYVHLFI